MRLSRGAVLLYTLILISVIMLIALAVLTAALSLFGGTQQRANAEKSAWIADAGLTDITRRCRLNAISPWDYRGERISFGGGTYTLAVEQRGERTVLIAMGEYRGARTVRTNSVRIHFFSDYALSIRGGYSIDEGQSNASFPILVDGSVSIRPSFSQWYLKSDEAHVPFISFTGALLVNASSNANIHFVAYGYRGPITVFTALERLTAGELRTSAQVRSIDMQFPALYAIAKRADGENAVSAECTATTNIVNPLLMTKQFLTSVGSGSVYLLDRSLPSYAHIYIIPRGVRTNRAIDPYRYDDALNTASSYRIDGTKLTWDDTAKRYTLLINDANLARMNEFPLASQGYNNCSEARAIREVFINGTRLESSAYVIQDHRIIITRTMPYTFSAGFADGRKTHFRIPRTNASHVFADGERIRDVYCEKGVIVFAAAPAYGKRIDCYEKMPLIEIAKDAISSSCDLYTDISISMRAVTLERLPAGTLRTDAPLFISGDLSRRTTIISTSDVYIGNIRCDRYPLAVYARTIFTLTSSLTNVFLFTEAPNVFSITGGTARIRGSIVLGSRIPVFSFSRRDMSASIIDEGERIAEASTSELLLKDKERLFFIE